ncbi:MAG: hypothetical protein GQ550_00460, partial [Gammaproteobacteria bacterium]|nr:hypothetical protein [Gammaproteobacteria bacterium]
MPSTLDTSLTRISGQFSENSDELEVFLKQLSRSADDNAIDRVISLYKKTIVRLEQDIWKNNPSQKDIKQYQNSFTILEKLHELKTVDTRYSFKIIIPVADRPQHLKHCLNSLLTLCKNYGYGGFKNRKFNKISVLIADDSSDNKNAELHKQYCIELTAQGINTEYFGLDEQLTLVNNALRENSGLVRIISKAEGITDSIDFSHKGASIMRNITYLKLKKTLPQEDNTLIYFIDSDQEFCINTIDAAINPAINSDKNHYAINYFHYLNEIFKTQDISILTGKVVGDPPVSPSVMAGNFQQDIQSFLNASKKLDPDEPCRFHQLETVSKNDSAYHDMANLFGFSNHEQAFDYHCTLQGEHNNADCFCDFSNKLGRFFYGEHPTRKTFFHYGNGFSATTPARTVYTGNYVIKPETLEHFIPFSTLKLRMAGPVLGRILNYRLQGKFVSANLPMLHNRTVDSTGQAEFRAGVENHDTTIDLGNEFIRQFFGDVMLFSINKITEQKLKYNELNSDEIRSIIDTTYKTIRESYTEKHNTILQLKSDIYLQLKDQQSWWNNIPDKSESIMPGKTNFHDFLENIQSNFSENSFAYQQISSSKHAEKYLESILQAILLYQTDIDSWKK